MAKFQKISENSRKGIECIDILVDGKFISRLADKKYHWAGSTNQRVIDVKKSLETGKIVLKGD